MNTELDDFLEQWRSTKQYRDIQYAKQVYRQAFMKFIYRFRRKRKIFD